ncbi:nucleotidyltransferase domain-containing protein [Candidatus Roizmanbacteria bacterium]|nr:nucleotidyltransferase domain-containing protein [Candidatus Roizmanbacteria bacterium]
MIDAQTKKKVKKIIFRFLDPRKYKVFIFGSRALGDDLKFSDIDIGIKSKRKINSTLLGNIKEAFEESNIVYKVEVVDFSSVSDQFRKVAEQKVIYLN